MNPEISIVIPVFNEEEMIKTLYERVVTTLKSISENYEIICVNDGSKDNTLSLLLEIHVSDKKFKVLNLSKNFGHQAAYTAGLTYAKGKYIAMLDGDLQDPPELLIDMIKLLDSDNFDIVYGKRIERKESPVKRMLIRLFHYLFSNISNINAPSNVGNFSVMNRKVLSALLQLNEKNRYLPGLRYFIGFRQGYVDYSRPDRELGKAKMNTIKLASLAFDAIFSFSGIPIKLCFYLGIMGAILSITGSVIVLIKKINGDAITGWTSVLLSIYFLGSVQLAFLGVLGEYVFRTYKETQNRPIFIVNEFYE